MENILLQRFCTRIFILHLVVIAVTVNTIFGKCVSVDLYFYANSVDLYFSWPFLHRLNSTVMVSVFAVKCSTRHQAAVTWEKHWSWTLCRSAMQWGWPSRCVGRELTDYCSFNSARQSVWWREQQLLFCAFIHPNVQKASPSQYQHLCGNCFVKDYLRNRSSSWLWFMLEGARRIIFHFAVLRWCLLMLWWMQRNTKCCRMVRYFLMWRQPHHLGGEEWMFFLGDAGNLLINCPATL